MSKTGDIKTNKLKILVYGESGLYKTRFAGTFPKPYFFDTDNGMLSLRDYKDIEYDTFIDGDLKNPTAAGLIEKKVSELQKECPYETIVVDSLTTVSDMAMNRILKINGRAGQVPQQQDWLQQMSWLRNFILTLLAMPKHVVFIAHQQIDKDENLGILKALPLVTGKLAGKIGLYFDEVYHAETSSKGKEIEFRLLTKANSIYIAKSRLGCFDMYEEPDFNILIKKVKDGISKEL